MTSAESSNVTLEDPLYQELPEEVFVPSGSGESYRKTYARQFFEKYNPRKKDEFSSMLVANIALSKDRSLFEKRVRKGSTKKINGMSAVMRRKLGLDKLPKKGLKFADFLPVHQCWMEYMDLCLRDQNINNWSDLSVNEREALSLKVWKSDLHGALLRVTRSKCPALLGIRGFVLMETKNMFKLLGPDNITRCIAKAPCEFTLTLWDRDFSLLGRTMQVRPADRAIKKIKQMTAEELSLR